jgi:hypothetical protein
MRTLPPLLPVALLPLLPPEMTRSPPDPLTDSPPPMTTSPPAHSCEHGPIDAAAYSVELTVMPSHRLLFAASKLTRLHPLRTALEEGHSQQALDRDQSMTQSEFDR